MFKNFLGKAVGGLMGKEAHGRIKGKTFSYSLSFENTKLPWKEMTKLGSKSILGSSENTPEFSWDKKFISSDFDGKTSAFLSVGAFNLNHSTMEVLLSHMKNESKTDEKELENTEAMLKMLRLGKILQETILGGKKFDDLYKGMEESMDNFFKLFYPEDEDIKRTSLKSHTEDFYGLESWSKIGRGVEGDQWLYTMYIPAGGVIYSIRTLVLFEKLSDEVRNEIEQITHSFRFEMMPIAIDELSKVADELEKKQEK